MFCDRDILCNNEVLDSMEHTKCNGDCFNCTYDDCKISYRDLIKQMTVKKRKYTQHRMKKVKGDFKAEYILTPLPGNCPVERVSGDD